MLPHPATLFARMALAVVPALPIAARFQPTAVHPDTNPHPIAEPWTTNSEPLNP